MKLRLLSDGDSNTKLRKSNRKGRYLTYGLSLAPYNTSGHQTCASASPGCASACIFTSGFAHVFKSVNESRIRKTKLFFEDRKSFKSQLFSDIAKARKEAGRQRKKLAIRLNVFSDLVWESLLPELFERFPDVQFYDYTKHYLRMVRFVDGQLPPNYHLTFSRSETNEAKCLEVLRRGGNVTVVFDSKSLPATYKGSNVINGDETDLRFLEGISGVVVGLYVKGPAGKRDESGFVVSASA